MAKRYGKKASSEKKAQKKQDMPSGIGRALDIAPMKSPAQVLAEKISKQLGVKAWVENKPVGLDTGLPCIEAEINIPTGELLKSKSGLDFSIAEKDAKLKAGEVTPYSMSAEDMRDPDYRALLEGAGVSTTSIVRSSDPSDYYGTPVLSSEELDVLSKKIVKQYKEGSPEEKARINRFFDVFDDGVEMTPAVLENGRIVFHAKKKEEEMKGPETYSTFTKLGPGELRVDPVYMREIVTYDKEQGKFVAVKRPSTDPCFDNFKLTFPITLSDGTEIKGVKFRYSLVSNIPTGFKERWQNLQVGSFTTGEIAVMSSNSRGKWAFGGFFGNFIQRYMAEYAGVRHEFFKKEPEAAMADFFSFLAGSYPAIDLIRWNNATRYTLQQMTMMSAEWEVRTGKTFEEVWQWYHEMLIPPNLLVVSLESGGDLTPPVEFSIRQEGEAPKVDNGGRKIETFDYKEEKGETPKPSIHGNCSVSESMRIDDHIFRNDCYNPGAPSAEMLEKMKEGTKKELERLAGLVGKYSQGGRIGMGQDGMFDIPPEVLQEVSAALEADLEKKIDSSDVFQEHLTPEQCSKLLADMKEYMERRKNSQRGLIFTHHKKRKPIDDPDLKFGIRAMQKPDGSIDGPITFDPINKPDAFKGE